MPEYCLFAVNAWWTTCMPRSDWAAWTQALGAIAAILAAIFIARGESRRTRNDRRDREITWERLAVSCADNVRHACSLRSDDFAFTFNTIANQAIGIAIERVSAPLVNAPVWDMRDHFLAGEISSIVYQAALATHALANESNSALVVLENLQRTCEQLVARYPPKQ